MTAEHCDTCGHLKARHEVHGFAPQCVADGCTCLRYRTMAAPKDAAPVAVVGDVNTVIRSGKQSGNKRIATLAGKIEADLQRLVQALSDDQAAEATRRKIAALERELAAAKATLKGGPTMPCPDCDKQFGSPQGLGAHRSRAHGYRVSA